MRGTILTALACASLAGLGCTTSARYLQKTPDGGVIELKAGADPKEAVALMDKHLGKDSYEMKVMPGTAGSVAQGSAFNPNATVQAGQTPVTPTVYQYSKKIPTGMTPTGLPPVPMDGGGIQQTGFQRPAMNQPTAGMTPGGAMKPPSVFPGQ